MMEIYNIPVGDDAKIVLTVAEKYFRVDDPWGGTEVVRRDSKFTSGYMHESQIRRIPEIEEAIKLYKELKKT